MSDLTLDTEAPAAPAAAAPADAPRSPSADWGRVGDDGTVYVRTSEGERAVGQMPDATPDEALAFFTKRYDYLAFEVELLEQRVQAGTVGPDEAAAAVKQVRATLAEAQAVGDLEGLAKRLETLTGLIGAQREKKKAERAAKLESARADKERIATEAEELAHSQDWRNGANRLRDLLDEWKGLPRLEKSVDDALWRRFSTARTTYTRRRKAHFGELNEKREGARVVKERLVKEAEELSSSKEWGETARAYRDLMTRWKAAGRARRDVEDQLWARFRAAQDQFFGARSVEPTRTRRRRCVLIDDPVDAAVLPVAEGIFVGVARPRLIVRRCGVVLDDGIVPVDHPEGTIRADLGLDRREPRVPARHEVPRVAERRRHAHDAEVVPDHAHRGHDLAHRQVFRTNNIDNCARYCQSPASKGLSRTVGYGADAGTMCDIERASLVAKGATRPMHRTGIVASSLPDIDGVVVFVGDKIDYLTHHRGWTRCTTAASSPRH